MRFLFCESGCAITQDMVEKAHPTYTEFKSNTYQDIFALKGAVLHANMGAQSDDKTYSVFNSTWDKIERVQNGAYLLEGNRQDTAFFQ